MELEKGQELEQNLARAFGISVEPVDPTLVPYSPVMLRVKSWPKPAYSPYSREQVLAATLQCVVRSTGGTPKTPLVVQVVTEDPADQAWAAKYAGKYITRPGDDGAPVEPTPVPGTKIETDAFGVTRVVFSGVSGKPALEARPPVWIPFRLGGESGPDEPTWILLPVWTGDDWAEPLDALGRPYTLFYDLFNPSTSFAPRSMRCSAGDTRRTGMWTGKPDARRPSFPSTTSPRATSPPSFTPSSCRCGRPPSNRWR
jgi:hypothetical protein